MMLPDARRVVVTWAAPGEPAIVGGLSFGGLASLHLALSRPERVRALLLIDTGPGFKKPEAQERWEAQVERTASFLEKPFNTSRLLQKVRETLDGTHP